MTRLAGRDPDFFSFSPDGTAVLNFGGGPIPAGGATFKPKSWNFGGALPEGLRASFRIDVEEKSPTRGQVFATITDPIRGEQPERRMTHYEVRQLIAPIQRYVNRAGEQNTLLGSALEDLKKAAGGLPDAR